MFPPLCRVGFQTASRRHCTARMCASLRLMSTTWDNAVAKESINVGHSRFLADSKSGSKWKENTKIPGNDGLDHPAEEYDSLPPGKGKLSPTSSHLFKLILPLGRLQAEGKPFEGPPIVFLLHPSQPLSHISRLIISSMLPSSPSISYITTTPKGRRLQWSESTDVGDFIRDVARTAEFQLRLKDGKAETSIQVEVPSFADRTRFLRRRLASVERELSAMETLKGRCDAEAHRGARKMALGGLAMLVVYWGSVARLTFWDLGWDIMEPVTYLSGLSMVILGYLWFLYQGREVSYSSVLDRSVSARRQGLYKARGFDIDLWADRITEAKGLHKEISRIAEDYDEDGWKEREEERDGAEEQAKKDVKEMKQIDPGMEKSARTT